MNLVSKANGLLACIGRFLQSPLLLVIRLYWGWQFFLTGRGKLEHLPRTTAFFQSLGIPHPHLNAIMASSTECSCGLLLLAGLFSRFATVPLTFCMCIAYLTADRDAVTNIFSDPDKFTGADPFLFLYAAVLVLCFGPGKIALDTLVFRERKA
jgi:putative oxidoreductase